MKIFGRVLLATGAIVAIGAAQRSFVVWDLSNLSDRIVEATTIPLTQVDAADRIVRLFHEADRQLAGVTDAVRFVSSSESVTEFKKTIAEIDGQIVRFSETEDSAITRNKIVETRQHLNDWIADALVLLGEKAAVMIVTPDMLETRKALIERDLGGLIARALDAADVAESDMLGLVAESRRRSVMESIASMMAGIGLALLSALSITQPMARLKRSMGLVAAGALEISIEDSRRSDEIGSMARALEVFRQRALEMRTLQQRERQLRKEEAEKESAHMDDTRKRQASFQLLFLSNPVAMWVHDLHTKRIIAVNDSAVDHYGYSREYFLALSALDIGWSKGDDSIIAPARSRVQQHRKADGAEIEVAVYESFLPYEERAASLVAAIDLTEQRRAEQRILHLAQHDALTDLPNRSVLAGLLASSLREAVACGESMAVLCLDLDHFKEVNDVFGHAVGDKLLQEFSNRLTAVAGGAFIVRMGGDEFTVISTERDQPAAAEMLAERFVAAATEDFAIDSSQIRVGLSIGVAVFPNDALDEETLLANADAALYRAKADGRGGVRFFEPEMDRRIRERHILQHDLRVAVERGELMLCYQPQATIDGEIFGFEALVRWRHPTRGIIPPAIFIPIAEESGLITSLGEWVLREACREAASWPRKLDIAINLSPIQFRRGDLGGLLHMVLLETGLQPSRLELEITEGVLMQDSSRSLLILRRLKGMGVTISMDDFGTGYSSLSYLQSFPFDKIKIDQSFISKVESNQQSAAIVRAVIGLGRGLDMPVIAEGVETAEQLAFLAKEQCDEVQGDLIGRPRSIDEYADVVGQEAYGHRTNDTSGHRSEGAARIPGSRSGMTIG